MPGYTHFAVRLFCSSFEKIFASFVIFEFVAFGHLAQQTQNLKINVTHRQKTLTLAPKNGYRNSDFKNWEPQSGQSHEPVLKKLTKIKHFLPENDQNLVISLQNLRTY